MNFYKDKKVLITGAYGLVGRELFELLKNEGAKVMTYDKKLEKTADVTDYKKCIKIIKETNPEFIFHCFGIKGSPQMTQLKPLSFLEPMIKGDTNMITAAREMKVKRFLYTSSIAVYYPEIDVYPSWAKKTGEKLIEATRIEYPNCETKYCIVRPSSIYGRFDTFEGDNIMVIPSLIGNALKGKLELWGDGNQTRDFINSKDVALGMMKALEEMPYFPVNLGSFKEISIKDVIQIISEFTGTPIKYISTKGKIMGAQSRIVERNWDFEPDIDIVEGLKEVINFVRA